VQNKKTQNSKRKTHMKRVIHKTKEYIKNVNQRPYHERKRLMWFYSIITIIIILLLWVNYLKGQLQLSLNKTTQNQAKEIQTSNIPSLIDNLKSSFKDFIEFLKPKPKFEDDNNQN